MSCDEIPACDSVAHFIGANSRAMRLWVRPVEPPERGTIHWTMEALGDEESIVALYCQFSTAFADLELLMLPADETPC